MRASFNHIAKIYAGIIIVVLLVLIGALVYTQRETFVDTPTTTPTPTPTPTLENVTQADAEACHVAQVKCTADTSTTCSAAQTTCASTRTACNFDASKDDGSARAACESAQTECTSAQTECQNAQTACMSMKCTQVQVNNASKDGVSTNGVSPEVKAYIDGKVASLVPAMMERFSTLL